jgi:hypothetical protein
MAVFWDVAPCSPVEGYRRFRVSCCPDDGGETSSETSVNFYQIARHNIPEDSNLHNRRRRENLKYHHL